MSLTKKNMEFVSLARKCYGDVTETISTDEIKSIVSTENIAFPYWLTRTDIYRVERGVFTLPHIDGTINFKSIKTVSTPTPTVNVPSVENSPRSYALGRGEQGESKIPEIRDTYVPFGNFKDIHSVIKSSIFFPTFITGLSGNGKTEMVEQVCAKLSREMFRVNITVETDEDDLIGGFRLVNGETVWFDGPVVEAMRRGAILLLDEIDLASNKIMCLQPVMEGKGIYIKKINEFVSPESGFNIVATANTKGKGDDSGMFMFTGVLNEAFLERFPITVEQDYPSEAVEKKILTKIFESLGQDLTDETNLFIDNLVQWASTIRKSFKEDVMDEIITTRRLVHIVNSFTIFGDKLKAIEVCTNRFDDETKVTFIDLYSKIDVDVDASDILSGTLSDAGVPAFDDGEKLKEF